MENVFRVGDLEVLVVSDATLRVPGTAYFAGTSGEQWERHDRWLDHDGNVEFQFRSFVVRSGSRRVLIDTGIGPFKYGPFSGGALLPGLAAAGVRPEDIDVVFITHLHFDHFGAVARQDGEQFLPVFPNAEYRWTGIEHEYWHSGQPVLGLVGADFPRREMAAAVAGRFTPAEDRDPLAPGVSVISLPGHTPGHAGVVLSSGDERAFILGDAITCPVQLEEPEWSGLGDIDPKLARQTQEAVAREIEGSGALTAAAHFPGLSFGRVLRGQGRRYWQPL